MPDERGKSPAFQFYPKDFLSDENQIRMSLAAVGIYTRLMCHCWNGGSLPTDPKALAQLSGATLRQLNDLWPSIAPCFRESPDGRLIHPRLERERDKQAKYSRRQTDAATSRWQRSGISHTDATALPRQSHGNASVALPVECFASAVSDLQSASPEKKRIIPRDEDWERFKSAYPAKGREQGFLANQLFLKACEDVGLAVLMAGVDRYAKSKTVRDGFVMGLQKWLEKGLWIQEPESPESTRDEGNRKAKEHLAKMDAERASRGR